MSHHWSRFSQGQNWHLCIEQTIKGSGREQVIWNSDVVYTNNIKDSNINAYIIAQRTLYIFSQLIGSLNTSNKSINGMFEWKKKKTTIMIEKAWFLCRISQTFHRVSTWHRATQGEDQEGLSRRQAYLTRILTYHTLLSWL